MAVAGVAAVVDDEGGLHCKRCGGRRGRWWRQRWLAQDIREVEPFFGRSALLSIGILGAFPAVVALQLADDAMKWISIVYSMMASA